jgi:hypothetical protein
MGHFQPLCVYNTAEARPRGARSAQTERNNELIRADGGRAAARKALWESWVIDLGDTDQSSAHISHWSISL